MNKGKIVGSGKQKVSISGKCSDFSGSMQRFLHSSVLYNYFDKNDVKLLTSD